MALGSTMKNRALAAGLGVALAYALCGGLWYMALTDKASGWNIAQKQYRQNHEKLQRERKLISEKRKWNEAYEAERAKMPVFPEGEAVDTHWLNRMDSIAGKEHVSIATRQPGQEKEVGDVFELPVEVKNFEAALESLVKFLFALEKAEEAMFDVRQITLRPSAHKGFLKGQFTLNCAYMRGDAEEEENPAAADAAAGDEAGEEAPAAPEMAPEKAEKVKEKVT